MAITLAAAAPGSIVKLNVGGEPTEFYVHAHGTAKTELVQRYVEQFLPFTGNQGENANGYIGGQIDNYLNNTYTAKLDPNVVAVLPTEITYEFARFVGPDYETDKKTIVRNVYMQLKENYKNGGAPAAATKSDGAPQAYWTSSIDQSVNAYYIDSSGNAKTQSIKTNDCVRPCLSLPNNTLVEDDGALVVVSQDVANLLPCIKY